MFCCSYVIRRHTKRAQNEPALTSLFTGLSKPSGTKESQHSPIFFFNFNNNNILLIRRTRSRPTHHIIVPNHAHSRKTATKKSIGFFYSPSSQQCRTSPKSHVHPQNRRKKRTRFLYSHCRDPQAIHTSGVDTSPDHLPYCIPI